MSRTSLFLPTLAVLSLTLVAGCEAEPARTTAPASGLPAAPAPPPPEIRKVPVGKNVFLEIQGDRRRVLVDSVVCLREGPLEQLLTRARTKEHEAILAADCDARDIHKALLAAGATPGSPVQFQPRFKPPTGTAVKVLLRWEDKGQLRTESARKWIMQGEHKSDLAHDWVFAGSRFLPDPDKQRPDYYMANDGDLVCVANFEGALLDLPLESSSHDSDRFFLANTPRIPPRDTRVTVVLEPVPGTGPKPAPKDDPKSDPRP